VSIVAGGFVIFVPFVAGAFVILVPFVADAFVILESFVAGRFVIFVAPSVYGTGRNFCTRCPVLTSVV
jgi:hypothetical protein